MYIQHHINIDSLKAVSDSLKETAQNKIGLTQVHFDITNVGQNEVILTVLGYGIVFLALLILYLFFSNFTRIISASRRKKLKAAGKASIDDILSGEVSAAIATALSLHFQEAHDIENTIITIKKVQSTYSPWNSKLYGLRQYPKN